MKWSHASLAVVVSAAFFLGTSARSLWSAFATPSKPAPAPRAQVAAATQPLGRSLVIEPDILEMGDHRPESTTEVDLQVRNRGDVILNDLAARSSCACITIVDPPKTLDPGATGTFRLRIKFPKQPGVYRQLVMINANDGKPLRATAHLVANVISRSTTRPASPTPAQS